ncbi:hypothetical protein [Paraflavitalea pollutisoli]|uniref:hypothetical protein n=1 Tax=Paraflavitalea pollutisoli TaxID=3034143 RepID=UPI0023EA81B1|nr:hypothetical protein [Paraflavitalea sp. H1-2-19X]
MKLMKPLQLTVLAGLLFTLSCKKRGDYEVPCRIKTITEKYSSNPDDPYEITTLHFNYTSWGDPQSLLFDQVITGRPNYYFYYDNQRRLIKYKQEYFPGNVELVSKYKYNSNNFIVSDSTWFAGFDENDPSGFADWWTTLYSYDSQGRVSKTVMNYANGQVQVDTYNYDARGNLNGDGSGYDNKKNFLRTNLILAFIHRNYSMNNATQALSYNSKNLPTSFSTDWRNHWAPSFKNLTAHEITYTCDSPSPDNF